MEYEASLLFYRLSLWLSLIDKLVLENNFCGKDVFPVLPTGFRKSRTDISTVSNFAFYESLWLEVRYLL